MKKKEIIEIKYSNEAIDYKESVNVMEKRIIDIYLKKILN